MEFNKDTTDKLQKIRIIKIKKVIIKMTVILITIILIFVAFIIVDKNTGILGGNLSNFFKIETTDKQEEEVIKVAEKKFRELGENIDKKDLEVLKIQRNGEIYYYISAKENTIEVREKDGKITRINSIPVE